MGRSYAQIDPIIKKFGPQAQRRSLQRCRGSSWWRAPRVVVVASRRIKFEMELNNCGSIVLLRWGARMPSKNERVEIEMKIMKARQLARAADDSTQERLEALIAEWNRSYAKSTSKPWTIRIRLYP